MAIPAFPEFTALSLAHLDAFYRAFQDAPPQISEYTFTNLFCWRKVYGFSVSALGGMLILRMQQDNRVAFFDPVGKGDAPAVVKSVVAHFPSIPWVRVPESTAAPFRGGQLFSVDPDEANADYVYRTQDLVQLAGRKYDGKRNLIKKFKSTNSFTYVQLDESHSSECLAFQDDWCSLKECHNDLGLTNEHGAVKEMIGHCHHFHLVAGGMRVDNRLCAIAIAERLNPQTLVMHVLKADPRIPGLYQTMLNEFLTRQAQEFEFVNLEQDLGHEGLRKAKRSYHPVFLVPKFTLQPRPHA